MATKNVTLSVRIPHEDAAFISQLQIDGATTPSDKLRALIDDARRRHEGSQDFLGSMNLVNELLNPVTATVREQEHELKIHSELVSRFMDWLPDVMAYVMTSVAQDATEEDLKQLETGVTDRVFRLMESVLQLGVTQSSPCYNQAVINERITPVLDLTQIIGIAKQQAEEKHK